jgi:hypothetical protein
VDREGIERILAACDDAFERGGHPDLGRLGFWKVVAAAKRDSFFVEAYGERIADIDRRAFRRAVRFRAPAAVGATVLVVGLLVGLALLVLAPAFPHPWLDLVLLAGFGAVDLVTHGLAHLFVGAAVGIRFTDWFFIFPSKPQPGFKTDYASYLRAPARSRAWMHAAGAITTKLVPFLVLPYAIAARADAWTIWVLLAIGIIQIVVDLLFSVRTSDWKRFRREMRAARR